VGAVAAHRLVGVRSGRRAVALLLLVFAGALWAPALARADGDPASDILIKERVFYPYELKLPKASTTALEKTIASARDKGYSVRVAMIAHDFDLGSAGLLYRQPKVYAKFLAQELAQFNVDWVLVVMPNGYGVYHCMGKKRPGGYVDPCEGARPSGPDEKLLRSLPAQEKSKQDFAAVSEVAVKRLAELHGASFASPLPKLLAGAAVLLALAAAGFFALRRRRGRRSAGQERRDDVDDQIGHASAGGGVVGGMEGANQ
jgi:hypothetical protein